MKILLSLLKKNQGLICISAHYSHWEILAFALAQIHPMSIVYRSLDNPLIDRFVNMVRLRYPINLIQRSNSFYQSLSELQNHRILGLLIDQRQLKNPLLVPFFGQAAPTSKGAATLAFKSKAPVIGAYIQRISNLSFSITIQQINTVPSQSFHHFVQVNTQIFTLFIEKFIRSSPEQWFWFHPRWKY